jgi:hypothetical protein
MTSYDPNIDHTDLPVNKNNYVQRFIFLLNIQKMLNRNKKIGGLCHLSYVNIILLPAN